LADDPRHFTAADEFRIERVRSSILRGFRRLPLRFYT
jgi:hypothetical protein